MWDPRDKAPMYTAQNTSDVHPTEEHLFAFLAAQPKAHPTEVARRRNALRQAMAAALVTETTEVSPLVPSALDECDDDRRGACGQCACA